MEQENECRDLQRRATKQCQLAPETVVPDSHGTVKKKLNLLIRTRTNRRQSQLKSSRVAAARSNYYKKQTNAKKSSPRLRWYPASA